MRWKIIFAGGLVLRTVFGAAAEAENVVATSNTFFLTDWLTSRVWLDFLQRFILVALLISLVALLIHALNKTFLKLRTKVVAYGQSKFKPLMIKQYQLLNTRQITSALLAALKTAKYMVIALLLFAAVPLIFSIFPITRSLALTIYGYIFTPLKAIGIGILEYIPNLFTIAVILFVAKYVFRTLKFIADELETGRLTLAGFYPDWARPTYILLKYILCAFLVAVIYPYLPGANSDVFKGVSVFVGILFSLGSSSAIGNIIAGLVITYMRPFKIGDRVKLGDMTGFVVEKSTMVTRIRTHKNEYITLPNLMVLNSCTTNYNKSLEEGGSVILYVNVTISYSLEWRQVHELLLAAAARTENIERNPAPFVLQLSLDDFYATYQLNAATKAVTILPHVYSGLFQSIQDVFREAGIDLTSRHYFKVVQGE
ncbi:mechanosensitive ion channel [Candidatus Termititenax persephonae]|uniref:Mechanosensitive ion channel n=1 Tax=Candidatus Termititenax persephonae TaxID=2218525 RepID=A0A388THA2_9BACT|nr:mechanosensitive ion channel [Candidatus Termititenax persephonae]